MRTDECSSSSAGGAAARLRYNEAVLPLFAAYSFLHSGEPDIL